jgi:hypothetical protein
MGGNLDYMYEQRAAARVYAAPDALATPVPALPAALLALAA